MEQVWHYEQTAGPSTAPLAIKLREAPLRMTIFHTRQLLTLDLSFDTAQGVGYEDFSVFW
jgi:hypothetical protein